MTVICNCFWEAKTNNPILPIRSSDQNSMCRSTGYGEDVSFNFEDLLVDLVSVYFQLQYVVCQVCDVCGTVSSEL